MSHKQIAFIFDGDDASLLTDELIAAVKTAVGESGFWLGTAEIEGGRGLVVNALSRAAAPATPELLRLGIRS